MTIRTHKPERRSPLTQRQLALLHVAKARLGLDDESYRDLLEDEAGVRSAAELEPAGLSAVMERLARLGFRPRRRGVPGPYSDVPRRPGMATAAQLNYLVALWRQYTGRADQRGLGDWLSRQCGVSDPARLDRPGVHKALVALKAMVARQHPPRDGTHG